MASHGDGLMGYVARMEQQAIVQMVSEDLRAILGVVRDEVVDLSARLNLTMRAVWNQTPVGGAV